MGDKISAKNEAEKAGIPIVPGFKNKIPKDEKKPVSYTHLRAHET